MKKYIWILNGLDCANCANKIEEEVGKLEFIQSSNVNFNTLKLSFEMEEVDDDKNNVEEERLNLVKNLIIKLEPDVEINQNEKNGNNVKKYVWNIDGLDCASCANKIEEEVGKLDFVKSSNVNFNTSKLSFEVDDVDENNLVIIKELIKKLEPEVTVSEINNEDNKKEEKSSINFAIIRLFIGLILMLIGCYVQINSIVNNVLIIMAYVVLLFRTTKNAIKMLVKNKSINENFLITISCIGAYFVGEKMEGLMVIFLYEIGKILEEKAVNKSRKSISDLMNIKPEYANLKLGDEYKKVSPENVHVNDVIVVKQGEKIPLDGVVVSGNAKLDTSALTGESVLTSVKEKNNVLSGSINVEGLLEIKVTEEYSNSTISRILELVENATDKKAKTETKVSKGAKIYTPVVLGLAALVAIFMPLVVKDVTYSQSIYKALTFLVISCPCAIAISVPLSYFSGIGRASKSGILIKGSNYLDALKDIKEIVFDKTGTLTTGNFNVAEINSFNKDYSKEQVLDYIAKGEKFSNHPIAKSVLEKVNNNVDVSNVKQYEEIAGKGIQYVFDGKNVKIGNSGFVEYNDEKNDEKVTIIYLKINDDVLGNVVIKDSIKESVKPALKDLKKMNIKTRMFTGDNKEIADRIGKEIGISEVQSEMLPTDKYNGVEKIIESYNGSNNKVAFVGDGINDSPVLALADVGISMGGVGSSSAIEASDVVIMTDDIERIVEGIEISKKTSKIINQNLFFAISVKVLVLTLAVIGVSTMWQAIFADVGVTLITILNTLRILRK